MPAAEWDAHPADAAARLKAEAAAVAELAQTRGWHVLLKRLARLRDEAHYHVLAMGESRDVGAAWRARLAALDEVIGLPDDVRRERLAAEAAAEEDKMLTGILNQG